MNIGAAFANTLVSPGNNLVMSPLALPAVLLAVCVRLLAVLESLEAVPVTALTPPLTADETLPPTVEIPLTVPLTDPATLPPTVEMPLTALLTFPAPGRFLIADPTFPPIFLQSDLILIQT